MTSTTVGGGFQEAVRKRGGVSGIRALAARRYPDIGVRVVVGDDESECPLGCLVAMLSSFRCGDREWRGLLIHATGSSTPVEEAARLARVPVSDWYLCGAQRGIVVPTSKWIDEDDKETQGLIPSRASVPGYLRLQVRLLRTQNFPMRAVVHAVNHLKDVFGPPGPSVGGVARIFSDGRDIWVAHKDTWEVTSASRRGQKAAQVLLGLSSALLKERIGRRAACAQ